MRHKVTNRNFTNYVDALLKLVFEEVVENPTPFVDELKSIPVPDHA